MSNPFDDDDVTAASTRPQQQHKQRASSRSLSSRQRQGSIKISSSNNKGEPAIWAARTVEWPLPTTLSLSHYQKLLQKQGLEPDVGWSSWMRLTSPTTTKSSSSSSSTDNMESRPLVTKCVATSNGWIVAALESSGPRLVSRWNVRRSDSTHSILCLPPASSSSGSNNNNNDQRILHIFCDPTACHTVLSAANGDLYYLHSSSKTIIALQGFGSTASTTGGTLAASSSSNEKQLQTGLTAGSHVTAIAWDRARGTEGSTKTILLGTSIGEVYEYSLEATETSDSKSSTNLPTLLHRVGTSSPIYGLYFDRSSSRMAILIALQHTSSTTRLYSFFSQDTSFRTAFFDPQLLELPGSIHAELHVAADSSFGLLTATGMYYGTLQHHDKIVQAGLLPYDHVPLSMALTPHHVIFLHEKEVVFYNRVSNKVIQKERIDWIVDADGGGQLLMDIRRPDQVWLRKGRTLVHISSTMEDRDVWKFTLQKCLDDKDNKDLTQKEELFEHAKALCTNSIQKAVVTHVRAEYHLSHDRPALAAKYWAQCPPQVAPFSDTALRLGNVNLIPYLSDKMRAAKLADDKVLSTMLGAWLTELHLASSSSAGDNASSSNIQTFLSQNVAQMDAKTILRILASHDVSASDCAAYAAASGDLGTAVQTATDPHEALKILNDAPLSDAEPYYYRYARDLYARAPLTASKSFLSRYSQGLSPEKLLPSLMEYEHKRAEYKRADEMRAAQGGEDGPAVVTHNDDDGDDEETNVTTTLDLLAKSGSTSNMSASEGVEVHLEHRHHGSYFVDDESASVKYLEGVIKLGCKSCAVYSFLISLYVKMDNEEPLLKFLKTHVPNNTTATSNNSKKSLGQALLSPPDDDTSPLDMSFALRTILSTGRHFRSAIRLYYMGFGLRQQAVELALKVDPALARELAHDAPEEEKKQLWLMICQACSKKKNVVVSEVVSVLKDCGPNVLSIEDVLPFLPDFCQIDQIKDEICDALTSYSSKIEGFLKEMNDADQTCDALRDEISRLSQHQMQCKANAKCALSGKTVLTAEEPFYVFPSGYVYLESALVEQVVPYLNDKQKQRVEDLQALLSKQDGVGSSTQEKYQSELDGLIAADCPLTGSIMVESISMGFPDAMEMDQVMMHQKQQGTSEPFVSVTS